jgi:hypothetical protein
MACGVSSEQENGCEKKEERAEHGGRTDGQRERERASVAGFLLPFQ